MAGAFVFYGNDIRKNVESTTKVVHSIVFANAHTTERRYRMKIRRNLALLMIFAVIAASAAVVYAVPSFSQDPADSGCPIIGARFKRQLFFLWICIH